MSYPISCPDCGQEFDPGHACPLPTGYKAPVLNKERAAALRAEIEGLTATAKSCCHGGEAVALLRRLLDENKGDPDGEMMVAQIDAYLEETERREDAKQDERV